MDEKTFCDDDGIKQYYRKIYTFYNLAFPIVSSFWPRVLFLKPGGKVGESSGLFCTSPLFSLAPFFINLSFKIVQFFMAFALIYPAFVTNTVPCTVLRVTFMISTTC